MVARYEGGAFADSSAMVAEGLREREKGSLSLCARATAKSVCLSTQYRERGPEPERLQRPRAVALPERTARLCDLRRVSVYRILGRLRARANRKRSVAVDARVLPLDEHVRVPSFRDAGVSDDVCVGQPPRVAPPKGRRLRSNSPFCAHVFFSPK